MSEENAPQQEPGAPGEPHDLDAEAQEMREQFGPSPEQAQAEQQQAEQQQLQQSAAEEWAGVCSLLLKPAAEIMAPNWHITGEEIGMLSDAYGACLAELFPDVAEAGPWVAAVACTGMVVAPRLGTPRKLQPKKPPEDNPESRPEESGQGAADGG